MTHSVPTQEGGELAVLSLSPPPPQTPVDPQATQLAALEYPLMAGETPKISTSSALVQGEGLYY